MNRPRLLDLFCCEGGAAKGYTDAGFEVIGVDIDPQPRYPYEFHQGDATSWPLDGYDAIHASPPCKDHTDLAAQSGGDGTGWMLQHTIDRLTAWVVENVESPSAKRHMNGALTLCGSAFGLGAAGRLLKRHRLFLTNVPMLAPPCVCSGWPIGGVYGTGGTGQMTRGYKFHPEDAKQAMGIAWMSRDGLSQAIPPAYAQFIGEQLVTALAPSLAA